MTKISLNYKAQDFVPKRIYDKFGASSTWFINPKAVKVAEFYKSFFTTYFKNKFGNDKVKEVKIVINNWSEGGTKQFSGLRLKECAEFKELSQHSLMNGFDCEIMIYFTDGKVLEANYKEIHEVIHANEAEFMANGVTCIEDVSIASGWLHTDFRWIPNQTKILVVKP